MTLLSARVTGTEALGSMLAQLLPRGRAAFMAATYLHATKVITSAMRLTPVLTGFLRRSRYVQHPTESGAAFTLVAGFSAPYAAPVHENTTARHPTGQAQFLRAAIDQHAAEAPAFLLAETMRLWKSGKGPRDMPAMHPTSSTMHGPVQRVRLNKRQIAKRNRAAIKNRRNLDTFGTTDRRILPAFTGPRRQRPKRPKP